MGSPSFKYLEAIQAALVVNKLFMIKKKNSTLYKCSQCDHQVLKWLGKCPECQSWNSFEASTSEMVLKDKQRKAGGAENSAQSLAIVDASEYRRDRSGIGEFDRVMGGGIVAGSLTLIGGEPGIGKSTLLAQLLGNYAALSQYEKVLYVTGEESTAQVADRMRRIGVKAQNLMLMHETSWQNIVSELKKIKPKFLVIDSIQTTQTENNDSPQGSLSQIREVTYELMNYSKAYALSCFLIGHITKEGAIAGPKLLEHMVDTVIYFEGDHNGQYRLLRSMKNRFGNTNEVGIFEMSDGGLREVKNAAQYFTEVDECSGVGRALTCIVEGSRCLLLETQALVVENKFGSGRRTSQGLEANRLSLIVAVIEKYFGLSLGLCDIYLNVVGNMKISSREADLSILAALLSSYKGLSIERGSIFMGEVGLSGEVRSITKAELRLRELAQLDCKRVITGHKIAQEFAGKFPNLQIIGLRKASEVEKYLS